ncbi:MAG: NCS2 family permease [Alphaproteobacteria bacterium]|jgi:AGZA family xanthine/uracil permease-like MFS transporter|tara:strand:- start:87 stop:1385 length:1299 start_codon:yes stop_codon:yes gene_type:complete
MIDILDSLFKLNVNGTSIKKEILAGFTTFITMSYIIFVNPQIMSTTGMDFGAVFVGTCLAASIACFIMGFVANWPVGLAPGMGLNAFFTYSVVGEMGYSWETALGAVFLSGILFFIMSATPLRKWMIDSIPTNLRIAMASGVGFFIGFIGLKNGGIIVSNNATFLSLGDFSNIETLLSALGFLLIAILTIRNIKGSIIISILAVTLLSLTFGLVEFNGIISYPPSLSPVFLHLDIIGAIDITMISIIASFLFVNLFDTTGTLFGVATRANFIDEKGNISNLDKALKCDSSTSIIGTFFGCAPVTSYVESSSGIEAGGRTGLTAITIGFLFLFSIFLSPLASIVPIYATSGALIYVSLLILSGVQNLDWEDLSELIPSLIIIVMIPLTFSIADGISLGFIAFIVMKIASGDIKSISSGAWFLTVIFVSKFIFL